MPKSKKPKGNQHFVNQEYLRNFATPESIVQHRSNPRKWHVHVFDKRLGRPLPSQPIRGVALGKFFYNARGEPETLEDQFAALEGRAANVQRKLLQTKDHRSLSAAEMTTFAKFVAAQYLRTNHQRLLAKWVSDEQVVPVLVDPAEGKEFVAHLIREDIHGLRSRIAQLEHEAKLAHFLAKEDRNETLRNIREQIDELASRIREEEKALGPANLEEARRKMADLLQLEDPNHRRDLHLFHMMHLALPLTEDFLNRVWRVEENKTAENFCTSDHPVLTAPLMPPRHEDLPHAFLTLGIPDIGDALNVPGKYPPFRFIFPLSPKLTLSLFPQGSNIGSDRELSIRQIKGLNELQVIQSAKQIYSCDTNFSFVDGGRAIYHQARAYIEDFHPIRLPDDF